MPPDVPNPGNTKDLSLEELEKQALSLAEQESVRKEVEKEERSHRQFTSPVWRGVTSGLGVFLVLFYFYNAGWSPVTVQYHRGIYVFITFILVFLLYPFRKGSPSTRPSAVDVLLALAAGFVCLYWMIEFEDLSYRAGVETDLDFAVSLAGILISLEVCRRVLGLALTLTGVLCIVYAYFGSYFPEVLALRGFSLERIATYLFLTQDGVFGVMADVMVTYVILFIFFGAFLSKSGAGRFFIDLPLSLAGRTTGGPAKVAVIASALFGSLSGSAIANTVTMGAFTIPLMKRTGFKPHVAGAIEASASLGGAFMPPVMGAGAFLMAELTRTDYFTIMKISLFPAIMYFFSIFCMIHFEAKKQGLKGLPKEQLPDWKKILKKEWFMSFPLLVIVAMMMSGYSPGMAAFWGTLACVAASRFVPRHKMGPREILEAILMGAENTLIIGATVGVIGVIVGTIALTGIGLKFTDVIISLSGGVLPLALLLIGLASCVLGTGVPVTATYLITAVLAVPALGMMGIAPITAHMIVFWLAQDSNITPPVCVPPFAAAAIAHADPWRTAWTSFKFAKLLYVMPFLFAYVPGVLLEGTTLDVLMALFSSFLGTLAFSSLSMFYLIRPLSLAQWILFAVATVFCYMPHFWASAVGIFLVGVVYFWQKRQMDRPIPPGTSASRGGSGGEPVPK